MSVVFNDKEGFSLIELMIVIAIIGILASIAVPSYRAYITKTRITNALPLMEKMKQDIEVYFQTTGSLPCCGVAPTGAPARLDNPIPGISTIYYWNPGFGSRWATIEAWLDSSVLSVGGALVLQANISPDNNSLTWACGPHPQSGIPTQYLPGSCTKTLPNTW